MIDEGFDTLPNSATPRPSLRQPVLLAVSSMVLCLSLPMTVFAYAIPTLVIGYAAIAALFLFSLISGWFAVRTVIYRVFWTFGVCLVGIGILWLHVSLWWR